MDRLLRVGFIGANWGMVAHLPAWRAIAGVEVVAVCTSRRETAEQAAATYGLSKAYWDYAEMARSPEIDILDIGTRPDLRKPMVLAALRAGKHVFASANFAASLEAAREMRDVAREVGVVAALDSVLPWNGAHRQVKALLERGDLGRPVAVATQLNLSLFNGPDPVGAHWRWFAKRSHGASALRNLGTHTLHLLVHLLGPVEAVAGQAATALHEWRFGPDDVVRPEVEDTAQLLLRFASGVIGTVNVSWASPARAGWRMQLTGDKASYVTRDDGNFPSHKGVQLYRGADASTLTPMALDPEFANPAGIVFGTEPKAPQSWDIAAAVQDMVRAIRQGGAALPSFEDAYRVEAILEAARRAIDARSWVDVAALGR